MKRLVLIAFILLVTLSPAERAMPQQTSAKGFVEQLLEGMLAAEGRSLSVENVNITLTGDVTVRHVEVSDDKGPWLVIDQLSLAWKPLSLFSDQLEIDDISVKQVHLLRMSQSPEGGVAAPQELQNLQAANIKHLAITDFKIDAPVLGQDAEMKLQGSGEITAAPVRIRVDARASRLDHKKGDLTIGVDLDPATRKFTADVTLAEAADGIVASLLALRGEPAVDLNLKAAGDFTAWTGGFNLAIDGEKVIDGTASATPGTAGQTIAVNGTGAMSRLLPQSLEQIFGSVSTLSAAVLLPREGGAAEVDHISLGNDALALNISGLADWTSTRTNLVARLASKDASAAIALPPGGPFGGARVTDLAATIGLDGELANPHWRMTLGWLSAIAGHARLDQLQAELEGQGIAVGTTPVSFKGSIKAGLAPGHEGSMPPALLGPLSVNLAGTWWDDDRLQIATAQLSAGKVKLETSGTVKPRAGSYDFTVSANAQSPETGYAAADRVLNGRVTAQGRITGGSGQWVGLEDFTIVSDGLEARASGTASGDSADLALDVTLPDLSHLDKSIAGTAALHGGLTGPWTSLAASIHGHGDRVTMLGKILANPRLFLKLDLADGATRGDFAFTGRLAEKPVEIHGGVATDPDGATLLHDFSVTAGDTRIGGDLTWPAGDWPTGRMNFDTPHLSDIGPLALSDISGTLSGTIEMTGAGDAHVTKIEFEGHDVATGSFVAGRADGSVTIARLFDRPSPAGHVRLAAVRLGQENFDTIDVTAKASSAESFTATVAMKGRDLSADAAGAVTFSEAGNTFAVSRLEGAAQGVAFKAAGPLTIHQNGDVLSLDDAVLNVGAGKVRLGGKLLPRLDAALSLTTVPLSALEKAAGVTGLAGTLSGEARLTGTTAMPEGRYDLTVADLRLAALGELGVEPITAHANGNLRGSSLDVSIKADAGSAFSLVGNGTIDFGRTSHVDMKLTGTAGSKLFSDRLAQSGLRAEGDIAYDLRLTGGLARPNLGGTLDVSNGVIGDTAGLYLVRDVTGRLELGDRVLRIVTLTGVTGRKGSVSATGSLALDGAMTIDLKAKVTDGSYSDGSFVTAGYDADLALSGSLAGGLLLGGDVGLKGTKITLSELPRRALSPLDVRHNHAPVAVRRQAAELRRVSAASSANLSLDLKLKAIDLVSVSGRGLNVVLKGGLQLAGAVGDLAAQGSFQMYRGRLALPARGLDFERGSLTFDRNFDPLINFVAVSRRTDATITLTVSGRASAPDIAVTSVPQLPPEEAMARLIFDNSMLELSPLQVAQIAGYVATLSGGGGSGLLSGLESALGVDWLTVGQTETGEAQVGVAKRINDRLSIGLEQTTQSNTTRVIIDLSATRNLKLRGSVDTNQSSRVGVYYETDY